MTKLVLNQVKKMAKDQGITEVKFTNKRGMQLPHSNWLAGVDCDDDHFDDEQSDDEDNEEDEGDYWKVDEQESMENESRDEKEYNK